MSQFFTSGGQSIGASASASVLPMNIHNWIPLDWLVGSPCSPRSSAKGNGSLLQYSCLKTSMDRRDWQPIVHGVTKKQTWLSDWPRTPKGPMTVPRPTIKDKKMGGGPTPGNFYPFPKILGITLLLISLWNYSEQKILAGLVTHSSILAWEIPWTEEPGRLQFWGVTKSWTRLSTSKIGTSLLFQWLRLCTHDAGGWVPSLVRELDPTCSS